MTEADKGFPKICKLSVIGKVQQKGFLQHNYLCQFHLLLGSTDGILHGHAYRTRCTFPLPPAAAHTVLPACWAPLAPVFRTVPACMQILLRTLLFENSRLRFSQTGETLPIGTAPLAVGLSYTVPARVAQHCPSSHRVS